MMEARRDIVVGIGGEGGEGVIVTGDMLTLAGARSGQHVFTTRTFPAEIKGGYCNFQLRMGDEPMHSHGDALDVLVCFNEEAVINGKKDLRPGGTLVYDTAPATEAQAQRVPGVRLIGLPMTKIASEELKAPLSKNMVALGATAYLLSIPFGSIEKLITDRFKRKGEKVLAANIAAIKAGHAFVEERCKDRVRTYQPVKADDRLLLSGNQALALGTLAAGVRLCAAYPITPASDIMEFLADVLPRFGGAVVQAEDEMAALGMVLGAMYTGRRAFTSTSGPGLSLMTEMIGLASMAEVPAVIFDIQRSGPCTGMPTKTAQADLLFAVFGGSGDAPRIVLAPTDVEDCYYVTQKCFDLAERYSMPVIMLSDLSLGHRRQTVPRLRLPENGQGNGQRHEQPQQWAHYRRYEITESGVSPRAVPGEEGGFHTVTGLEHDEFGAPCYEPSMHQAMNAKRFRKFATLAREGNGVKLAGDAQAEVGILGWGSTYGAVLEAVARVRGEGRRVKVLYPTLLNPMPRKEIGEFLRSVKKVVVPELNFTGHFATLLRAEFGIDPIRLDLCQGVPFTPGQIYATIKEVIGRD
ncbi:MAG: 2-oxoacid:acceptor oxidoreductase subunit alpha [Deltaproteobacteria bacterium]|nr:2-oxoacid:acceptor oxidoreductase subunit alpha [Deltaproteobacteria bacterium]